MLEFVQNFPRGARKIVHAAAERIGILSHSYGYVPLLLTSLAAAVAVASVLYPQLSHLISPHLFSYLIFSSLLFSSLLFSSAHHSVS
jgi:hypothetical protein